MRRSGAPAAESRAPRQRAHWQMLAPRLLVDVAPQTPPPRLRESVVRRLQARG